MYIDIDAILDEPGILKLDDPAILDLDDDALLFEDYEEESGQSDQLLARWTPIAYSPTNCFNIELISIETLFSPKVYLKKWTQVGIRGNFTTYTKAQGRAPSINWS